MTLKMRAVVALVLSCLFTAAWLYEDAGGGTSAISLGAVTVTPYQAVCSQTDGAPFITADGTDLRETDEQICALSQDFFWFTGGPARWGDVIILYVPGYPEGPVVRCVARDTMAPEIYRDGKLVPLTRHVDLLANTSGKWTGRALLIKGDARVDHDAEEVAHRP